MLPETVLFLFYKTHTPFPDSKALSDLQAIRIFILPGHAHRLRKEWHMRLNVSSDFLLQNTSSRGREKSPMTCKGGGSTLCPCWVPTPDSLPALPLQSCSHWQGGNSNWDLGRGLKKLNDTVPKKSHPSAVAFLFFKGRRKDVQNHTAIFNHADIIWSWMAHACKQSIQPRVWKSYIHS